MCRTIALFLRTGSVLPQKRPCRKNFRFTEEEELYIIGLIFEYPAMYLDEIMCEIANFLEVEVSLFTVCRLGHHVNKISCFSSFCLQKFGEGEAIYYLYLEVKGHMRLFLQV